MDQEEQQEITICWRCNEEMHEDQQKIQLLCQHSMHTNCFLQIVHLNYPCPHCNEPINPNDVDHEEHQEHQEQTEESRIQTLYENDNAFQTLAKTIVKKRLIASRKEKELTRFIKMKKGEIRNQLLAIKAQLEGLTETKKREIRESNLYKECVSAKRGYSLLTGKLRETYECSERKMARALRNKPGFRRFTPLRYHRYRRNNLFYDFYYRICI
jgi:hypothetical protein